MTAALPCYYIPHGGGPCFFMDWTMGPADTWDRMAAFLRGLAAAVGTRPRALLIISAHWEANPVRINSALAPPLIYDYQGFPPHTYQLRYDAPGAPWLADRASALLGAAGIASAQDPAHGLDHGVFIPCKLIYPDADIPVVQISLHPDLDPGAHLALGAALAPLRREGILLIGSGMSYHNMAILIRQPETNPAGDAFDAWLRDACVADPDARNRHLAAWHQAPGASHAHPRAEHLLPLHVIAGAAGADPGLCIYRDRVLGAPVSAFQFAS
ncbi:MAG: dioxygenase [Gammaproteobacteria bacterium]|nr:dioxygenase [Gammaproteobacteria bacterium]